MYDVGRLKFSTFCKFSDLFCVRQIIAPVKCRCIVNGIRATCFSLGEANSNRLKPTFGNYAYPSVEKSEKPEGDFIAEAVFNVVGYYKTVGDVADLSEPFPFASYFK